MGFKMHADRPDRKRFFFATPTTHRVTLSECSQRFRTVCHIIYPDNPVPPSHPMPDAGYSIYYAQFYV